MTQEHKTENSSVTDNKSASSTSLLTEPPSSYDFSLQKRSIEHQIKAVVFNTVAVSVCANEYYLNEYYLTD